MMDVMEFSTTEKIAGLAAVIAVLALLVSVGSLVVARKAFKLSKKEHEERYLSVQPYLIHAYKQRFNGERYCFFALSYTNKASVGNSISAIDLELEYADEEGAVSKIKVRPTAVKLPAFESDGYQQMNVPVRMQGKESVSGWVAFQLPDNGHRVMDVQCYRVHARLANDEIASVRTYLVNEVQSDRDEEDD